MGIKTYNDIASMQNNPSTTGSTGATRGKPKTATGGRIKVAKGGRVRKQRGSVTSVRGRGGPNIRPNVNVLGVEAARAHQRARAGGTHASELARQQGATPQAIAGGGNTGTLGRGRTAPKKPAGRAGSIRPGYKKGGRISKAKGGKAKR